MRSGVHRRRVGSAGRRTRARSSTPTRSWQATRPDAARRRRVAGLLRHATGRAAHDTLGDRALRDARGHRGAVGGRHPTGRARPVRRARLSRRRLRRDAGDACRPRRRRPRTAAARVGTGQGQGVARRTWRARRDHAARPTGVCLPRVGRKAVAGEVVTPTRLVLRVAARRGGANAACRARRPRPRVHHHHRGRRRRDHPRRTRRRARPGRLLAVPVAARAHRRGGGCSRPTHRPPRSRGRRCACSTCRTAWCSPTRASWDPIPRRSSPISASSIGSRNGSCSGVVDLARQRGREYLPGTTVSMLQLYPSNYAHNLMQGVSRVDLFRRVLDFDTVDRVLMNVSAPGVTREALARLGFGPDRVLEVPDDTPTLVCERLLAAPCMPQNSGTAPWALTFLRELFDAAPRGASPSRIFVVRDAGDDARRGEPRRSRRAARCRAGSRRSRWTASPSTSRRRCSPRPTWSWPCTAPRWPTPCSPDPGRTSWSWLGRTRSNWVFSPLSWAAGLEHDILVGVEPSPPLPYWTWQRDADQIVDVERLGLLVDRIVERLDD